MTDKRQVGNVGEQYTANFLVSRGYTILHRNWHSQYGEIDIVATKGDIIAFVEVKTRKKGTIIDAELAVNNKKQHKIILTAQDYIMKNSIDLQPRFDVSAVSYEGEKYYCKYYVNAFQIN